MDDLLLRFIVGAPILTLLYIGLGLLYKGVDRKVHAQMQWRVGPPILQPFYDVRKLLTKQNLVPENSIKLIFHIAPILAFASPLLALLYIPFGNMEPLFEGYGDMIIVIYLLSAPPLALSIGGFSSGSPYATIGSQREVVAMIAYELPLAVTIATVAWLMGENVTGFSLATIAANPVWGLVGPIGIVGLILLLVVFLIVVPAEAAKVPFDIAEAETELAEGCLAEYSGRNLALFYMGDAVKTIALSALVVVIFFPYNLSPLLGVSGILAFTADAIFFILKILAFMLISITFVRTAFARIKVDQFSRLFMGIISTMSVIGLVLVWIGGI